MAILRIQAKEKDIVEINWVDKDGKIIVESRTMPIAVDKTKSVFRATEK